MAGQNGGPRPGAGRPRGSANKKTQEIAAQAMAEGITPLEVMLKAMRMAWENSNISDAVEMAAKAAPYVHPRLQAVDTKLSGGDGPPVQLRTIEHRIIDPRQREDNP
jgi:hypothetical protein